MLVWACIQQPFTEQPAPPPALYNPKSAVPGPFTLDPYIFMLQTLFFLLTTLKSYLEPSGNRATFSETHGTVDVLCHYLTFVCFILAVEAQEK